jgi:hypothetical protein
MFATKAKVARAHRESTQRGEDCTPLLYTHAIVSLPMCNGNMCSYEKFHIPGDRCTRKTYCVYLEDTAEDLDVSDALDMYNQLVTRPQITGCWEVDGDPREMDEADAAHAERISIAVA